MMIKIAPTKNEDERKPQRNQGEIENQNYDRYGHNRFHIVPNQTKKYIQTTTLPSLPLRAASAARTSIKRRPSALRQGA